MIKKVVKNFIEKIFNYFINILLNKIILNYSSIHQELQIIIKFLYQQQVYEKKRRVDFEEIGFNVFSSTNEDGILLYIFSIIGFSNRKCVDIRSGSIRGSNVANLIINQGFDALLIDANIEQLRDLESFFNFFYIPLQNKPKIVAEFINAENINYLLEKNGFSGEIDFLTIDIDGIDYWIWKAINVIKPRVVMVEYQDALGPEKSLTVPYSPTFNFKDYEVNKSDFNYMGASLNAFVKLAKQKGYKLVGCNKGGWNAFFVLKDLAPEFLPEVTPESCFKYERNIYSLSNRYPLIKDMNWIEV